MSYSGAISTSSFNGGLSVTSTPGAEELEITGFPSNIIQLAVDASKSVAASDDRIMLYADLLSASRSALSLAISNIGTQQAFIDFNIERLTNNMYTLKERENLLEHPDMGKEITDQKVLEMLYNASLQMSAATIPMSLFNFIR